MRKKATSRKPTEASIRLFEWRKSLDLTQPQAAEKLNVPLPTYRNWEQAVSRIPGIVWAFIGIDVA
jgi:DNA-binding transcriptional regulator YiaG